MRVSAFAVVSLVVALVGGSGSGPVRATAAAVPFGGGYGPVWSPDGTRLAFIGPVPDVLGDPAARGFMHVLVTDGSSAPKVVATAPPQQTLGEVRWAAGGRFVYEDSNYTLWSTGHPARRLGALGVTGVVGESFSLSRDGRQVAFTAPCNCGVPQGDEVRLVPASGGASRALPRPKGALDSDPSFSPDGSKVAFARVLTSKSGRTPYGNEFIEVEAVHGGAARSLGVNGSAPVFSPDGRWVAFVGRAGIEVVAAGGGHARTLLPLRCCSIRAAYAWSPDAKSLAYVSDTGAGTVTLAGSRTVFSIPGLHPDLHTPQWSPDGKTIAFGAIRNGDDLGYGVYLIGADGAGLRRVA